MDRNYSIAQARDQLAKIVHAAERGRPTRLTRRGKPVAMLVSLADYERLRSGTGGFYEGLLAWRAAHPMKDVGIGPAFLEGLRDAGRGREIHL